MPLGFIFVWSIQNFSYYWQHSSRVEIVSPVFDVNFTGSTKWRLVFSDGSLPDDKFIESNKKQVHLYLRRVDKNRPNSILLTIKIAFVKDDKSILHWSEKNETIDNNNNYVNVCGEDMSLLELKQIFPEDILTVRCIMWHQMNIMKTVIQCFANSYLAVEHMSFVANFYDLIPGLFRNAQPKSASVEQQKFSMNIRFSDKGRIYISIPVEADNIYLCFCKVLILDNSGNWLKCGQESEWRKFGEVCECSFTLDFQILMMEKYLQNGKVTLKCEMIYSTSAEPERFETIQYGFDSYETCQQSTPFIKNPSPPETKNESLKSPSTLAEDLISLYKEETLCDTKLRTETETFPVHKTVLSARSPVFKKMFTTDMREKTVDFVEIPDLNADTVRKLLMFIYTDTLHAMDWQTAKELYFTGDKYEIVSLKQKCSTFLKLNIRPSNCCELLLLSDMHQDAALKQFVQNYIISRDRDVFGSEEWRVFSGSHVQLAADTMCLKYIRN